MSSARYGFDPERDDITPPSPDASIRHAFGLPPLATFDHLMTMIESTVLPPPEGTSLSDDAQILADAVPAFRRAVGLNAWDSENGLPRDEYRQLSRAFAVYAEENTALTQGISVQATPRQGLFFSWTARKHRALIEPVNLTEGQGVTGRIRAVHLAKLPHVHNTAILHEIANGRNKKDPEVKAALTNLDIFLPVITLTSPAIHGRDGQLTALGTAEGETFAMVPIWEWLTVERFVVRATEMFGRHTDRSSGGTVSE